MVLSFSFMVKKQYAKVIRGKLFTSFSRRKLDNIVQSKISSHEESFDTLYWRTILNEKQKTQLIQKS